MLKKSLSVVFIFLFVFPGCSGKKTDQNAAAGKSANSLPVVKNLLLVGINGYRAGLYEYNFNKKKLSLFWSDKNESVVDLSYSLDMQKAYILTARDYGKTGALPFIKDAKLYLFDSDSNKIDLIEKIGSGVQVFMRWGTDNTFKVMLNSIDLIVATYINQRTQIFNTFGKKLFDEEKTYDITKEGYPKPSDNVNNFISPDKKYSLYEVPDSNMNSVYVLFRKMRKKTLLLKTARQLNRAEWSGRENYLVFSTLNISRGNKTLYSKDPETSSLYIYSMKSRRILKEWGGSGLKNFYVTDKFLIFDDGFAEKSSVNIFNLTNFKPYDTIKIKKGCGLQNIPRIPDYN